MLCLKYKGKVIFQNKRYMGYRYGGNISIIDYNSVDFVLYSFFN